METLDAYVESLILEGVEKDYNSKNNDSYSSDITQRLIMWENYLDGRFPADALRGNVQSQIIKNQMKKRDYELSRLEKRMETASVFCAAFFYSTIINCLFNPSLLSIGLPAAITYILMGIAGRSIHTYRKKSKEKDDEYNMLKDIGKENIIRCIKDVSKDVEKIIREYK
jgi:hypothetical protein